MKHIDDAESSLYERLLHLVSEGVYVVNREREILLWNPAAESITGYAASQVIGRPCADGILRHCNDRGEVLCGNGCPLAATMVDGRPRDADIFLLHHDGHRVPVRIRSHAIRDEKGIVIGCAELFADSSPMNAVLDELRNAREDASIDPLTNVGNRRVVEARLAAFGGSRRSGALSVGVIFFDIDDFKDINDVHGHAGGDRVIAEVARTAAGLLRSFDTLGRWGGDEFVVIVPGVTLDSAAAIAERFRAIIAAAQFPMGGHRIGVTISAGVTLIGDDESGAHALARADRLMYASKQHGRNRITAA